MLGGIRTPDLLLRRQLLYPAELQTHFGADEGNRTLVISLEGWNSTIELHPRKFGLKTPLEYVTITKTKCQGLFFAKFYFLNSFIQVPTEENTDAKKGQRK